MDPFIQHFNNIFMSSPIYETFEDCIEAIKHLTNILNTQYITQFAFVSFTQDQPKFQRNIYPGVEQLEYEMLNNFFKILTGNELQVGQSAQFYLQQTNYILQLLEHFRRRLMTNLDEPPVSLLQLAWTYQLRIQYEQLKAQSVQAKSLKDVTTELSHLYFNAQCDNFNVFIQNLELNLEHLHAALSTLISPDLSFVQQLNKLLLLRGYKQITLDILDSMVVGCEAEFEFAQLRRVCELCQSHFTVPGKFFQLSGFLVVHQFVHELNLQFPNLPVKQVMNLLVKEEIEHQILNTVSFTSKQKMFCFTIYMLSGIVFQFDEPEFYLNLTILLENLYRIINKIFKPELRTMKKRSGFCRGPEHEMDFENEHANIKDFYPLIQKFSNNLKPFVRDTINSEITLKFEIYDGDLNKLLKSLGGFKKIYQTILWIWLCFKSIFRTQDVNYLFEGIQQLIINANDLNSYVQPFISHLDEQMIGLELEEGLEGVNQLLGLINRQLNLSILGGIIVDETVGGILRNFENDEGDEPIVTLEDNNIEQPLHTDGRVNFDDL
ncbi:Conserved_hypothetical protein [Hexamita inflata]|uniref:Uncharacterized protein n=1 Tax=Hexamita inflata TaxID=28002 RepID=A0ABP1H956_9EUKA